MSNPVSVMEDPDFGNVQGTEFLLVLQEKVAERLGIGCA